MTDAPRDSSRSTRIGWVALVTAVGLIGFGVRFAMLWRSGPLSIGYYDDGVHFAAAVDLVHGRLPYRDVLFLQPPGILLATSPFAAVAQVIGDARAFALARIAFAVVGAVNAALVAAILRRFGTSAAVVGGLLYALSFTAAYAERTVTIEAPATTGVLIALLLIPRARHLRHGRWYVLAGVAAGAAVGLKIWYVVVFVLLLVWARGGRLRVLVGGVVACLAIYGPFFLASPALMFRDIVTAQLGRPDLVEQSVTVRLRSILGIDGAGGAAAALPQGQGDLLLVILLAVLAILATLAVLDRRAWVFVALLVATAAVLLIAPSYYTHYAVLCAAPLALVGGIGAQRIVAALPGRTPRIAVVALVAAAVVGLNLQNVQARLGSRAPVAGLRAAAAQVGGCVVSDDPTVLAILNRLTPQIEAGCDVQADPSGQGYVLPYPDGVAVLRIDQPAFQREIVRYMHSGSAWIRVRGPGLGMTDKTRDLLDADPVLFKKGRFVLHATPPPAG